MQRFKAHIAVFLLVGFLFPQGASGMHYFVVAHNFYDSSELVFNNSISFDYHSCNYHLNGFSPLILGEAKLSEPHKTKILLAGIKYCCLENYVHQPDFNFQLRGPPFKVNFQN
jgi:hypothetical protein